MAHTGFSQGGGRFNITCPAERIESKQGGLMAVRARQDFADSLRIEWMRLFTSFPLPDNNRWSWTTCLSQTGEYFCTWGCGSTIVVQYNYTGCTHMHKYRYENLLIKYFHDQYAIWWYNLTLKLNVCKVVVTWGGCFVFIIYLSMISFIETRERGRPDPGSDLGSAGTTLGLRLYQVQG